MKYLSIPILLLVLGGCATTNVALTSADKPDAGSGTLQLVWLFPNTAEVQLDGKRYAGEWADRRCSTPQCLGEFSNVPRSHQRHIRKGSAELVDKNNTRLKCEWVSHYKEVIGTCQADDGRKFKLKGNS